MEEGSRLSDRNAPDQIARLEACVASDPGASEFPALAEALRRAGRLAEAEEVARRGLERKPGSIEGTLLLALTLLEQGCVEAARRDGTGRLRIAVSCRTTISPKPMHPDVARPIDLTSRVVSAATSPKSRTRVGIRCC